MRKRNLKSVCAGVVEISKDNKSLVIDCKGMASRKIDADMPADGIARRVIAYAPPQDSGIVRQALAIPLGNALKALPNDVTLCVPLDYRLKPVLAGDGSRVATQTCSPTWIARFKVPFRVGGKTYEFSGRVVKDNPKYNPKNRISASKTLAERLLTMADEIASFRAKSKLHKQAEKDITSLAKEVQSNLSSLV